MPEMSLSEDDNFFFEAVRRGDVRQVKEHFKKKPKEFQSKEAKLRDTTLGSFGLILAAQQDNYELVKFCFPRDILSRNPILGRASATAVTQWTAYRRLCTA